MVLAFLARRVTVARFGYGDTQRRDPTRPDVIDGDFIEIEPDQAPKRGSSGWTRH